MTDRARQRLLMIVLLGIAASIFFTGIQWGLPTRESDRYLFGDQPAWEGKRILAEGGAWRPEAARAADQDSSPVAGSSGVVTLSDSAADRAQIYRRYRLFSHQPDEMVTFMALAGMRGGFDPRMYQYGGLWIYPVGALLRAGGTEKIGLVKLTSDLAHYLDHPDDFGRFYIVARAYSAAWGLVGVWAMFHILRKIAGGWMLPFAGALGFALMPVVVNAAHEAKPHLAGAVLVMLTVLAGARYVERGGVRAGLLAGTLAGAAVGMVLSSIVAFLVLPAMVILRCDAWTRRVAILFAASAMGFLVYCVTNPFVPINLLTKPDVVRANLGALGQAKAIVGSSTDASALQTAAILIADGASPLIAFGGALTVVGLVGRMMIRRRAGEDRGAMVILTLLAVPCAVVLIQFLALARGKPGEFGRFAILPDVGLLVAVVAGCGAMRPMRGGAITAGAEAESNSQTREKLGGRFRALAAMVILLATIPFGLSYVLGFVEDCDPASSTRARAARRLAELETLRRPSAGGVSEPPLALATRAPAQPAPYNVPPVNLGVWRMVMLPADAPALPVERVANVIVTPVEHSQPDGAIAGTPYVRQTIRPQRTWFADRIRWADKPIELLIRADGFERIPTQPE